jgi:ABC-type Fe3+-siderophore transport system permease subunit
MTTSGETQARPSVIGYVLGGLALAALLAMSILFLATGLLAPLWAIIGFIAVWASLFVLGCIWIRRHPWRVVLLPFVAGAILFGGINAGEALLGWRP